MVLNHYKPWWIMINHWVLKYSIGSRLNERRLRQIYSKEDAKMENLFQPKRRVSLWKKSRGGFSDSNSIKNERLCYSVIEYKIGTSTMSSWCREWNARERELRLKLWDKIMEENLLIQENKKSRRLWSKGKNEEK